MIKQAQPAPLAVIPPGSADPCSHMLYYHTNPVLLHRDLHNFKYPYVENDIRYVSDPQHRQNDVAGDFYYASISQAMPGRDWTHLHP